MKTRIAIPTDFTVESLNTLKILLNNSSEKLDIILVHGAYIDDSISDMLFFSKTKLIKKFENKAFIDACHSLQENKLLESLRVDLFTGFNISAFNSYIQGNKIVEIAVPANYKFLMPSKKSFDLMPFIEKTEIPVTEVSWFSESSPSSNSGQREIFIGVTTS